MTTAAAVAGAELVPVSEPLFSEGGRVALAGFLAGYSGLTCDAYTLDLRMYAAWCVRRGLHLFPVRRADIECFGRDMEAAGRARATIARRLCTIAGFLPLRGSRKTCSSTPQPPMCGGRGWITSRTRSGSTATTSARCWSPPAWAPRRSTL